MLCHPLICPCPCQADASLNAAPVELVINMVNVFNLTHLTSMELELSKGRIEGE
jgi:hypothetical protein